MSNPNTLHIILHAPTASSLKRARSNAANLSREAPDAIVRIIANAEAVAAAIESPDAHTDALTWLCPNTLKKMAVNAPGHLHVLDEGAVLAIAKMQAEGWCYIRS